MAPARDTLRAWLDGHREAIEIDPHLTLTDPGHGEARLEGHRRAALTLIVLDEVANRGVRFVQLGRMDEQVVPVSFYGMGRGDEA